MSHLGERLTALVDGELEHDERDRAYAHLAGCAACRADAEALRRLKSELRSLDEAVPAGDFLTRLYTVGGAATGASGGRDPDIAAGEPRTLPGGMRQPTRRGPHTGRRAPAGSRPAGGGRPRRGPSVVRSRYLAMGAATLAVLGMGAASVAASAPPERLPQVAPALERLAVEYVLMTTGGHPSPEATRVADRGTRP